MSYEHLQSAVRFFAPILPLETLVPHGFRRRLQKIFGLLFLVFFALAVSRSKLLALIGPAIPTPPAPLFPGLALIFFSLFVFLLSLDAMFYSYYFGDAEPGALLLNALPRETNLQYELAELLYSAKDHDVIRAFVVSPQGALLMRRLGIEEAAVTEYLAKEKQIVSSARLSSAPETIKRIEELALYAYNNDALFANLLASAGIAERELNETIGWVMRSQKENIAAERWWGKERLGALPGIGKDWMYGQTFTLNRYARDITDASLSGVSGLRSLYGEEASMLAVILERAAEANAMIVAEEGAGAMEVVAALAATIARGSAAPALEHKRLMLVDSDALSAATGGKSAFEALVLALLKESIAAGNIILVFEHFPAFLESARVLGTDLAALFDEYFASPHLQVIAFSTPHAFHEVIERNSIMVKRFEVILLPEPDRGKVVRVLEDEARAWEKRGGFFFTHPALSAVAEYADRYIPYGVMPDKAIDLLTEAVAASAAENKYVLYASDVEKFVTQKTGIPAGALSQTEREKLENLETLLHERVIGQEEALKAIASAMQRARSGLASEERPIGAFLFLGPTGVGKTETAKALADIFFGSDKALLRFDMSEYNGEGALARLIGSFESGKGGTLAAMLKERPYGVLLLDEFEKTDPKVLDLFLQVFDEGFFSDAQGKRVSARNLIMIATSNAASDRIWEYAKEGGVLTAQKDRLIDTIITRGIFKPELLNRFDDVVLFHPLTRDELKAIARLMLQKLTKQLNQKGIRLVVSDALVAALVKAGYDPQFGARPMRRAIQDNVEQVIAKKLISGALHPGMSIELSEEELGDKSPSSNQ